jgi:hypothetical protein
MIFSPFLFIPLFFIMLLLLEAGRRFNVRTGLEPSTTIEKENFTNMVGFAALVSLTIGAIFDIEYPSHGLIRLKRQFREGAF